MDWLDINKLIVNTSYQRTTSSVRSQNNIAKIINNFAWSKFAPIIVSDNGDNTYNVIDGQHRLEACKKLQDISCVPCYIVSERSIEEQATDFAETNSNRVSVNAFDLFKAKIACGDEEYIKVKEFCDKYGLTISPNGAPSNNPNMVYAFEHFKKLLKTGREEDLAWAVDVIMQTFPNMGNRFRRGLIYYLANMHKQFGAKFNRQAIVNALRSFGSPALLSRRATNARTLDPSLSIHKHYERIINNEYNKQFKILKGIK